MSDIYSKTTRIIHELWGQGNPDKAALSTLRTTKSINDPKANAIWPYLFKTLEKADLSRTGRPTYAENAVYTALQAYAILQQSNDQPNFGKTKVFNALGQLRLDEHVQKGLDRRAQLVFGNNTYDSLTKALLQLIHLLKSHQKTVQLDFGQLAQDLYYFQFNRELARKITLKWGQQYYWIDRKKPVAEANSTTD